MTNKDAPPRYWDGTVVCPRKGLCHINHTRCLEMFAPAACGECLNHTHVIDLLSREAREEKAKKAERRALAPDRNRRVRKPNPKDPAS